MKLWVISTLLLSLMVNCTQSYEILMLAPFGSWSEYQLSKVLCSALVDKGHQITLISEFRPPSSDDSIKELFVGPPSLEEISFFDMDMMKILFVVKKAQYKIANIMYTNEDILEIWNNRNNYDAIIAYSGANEIITPFLIDYEGVYIGLCAMGVEASQILGQGNRLPRSVTPHAFMSFDSNMSFWERVANQMTVLVVDSIYDYIVVPGVQNMLKNYFPGMPTISNLYRNYSLLLVNSHFAMDGMFPLLPNQVEIGTLAAKPPKPLSKDLQEFVDAAEHGIIYFSLGSAAKSTDIPKPQMAMLLEAFRQLPQRVIWKFEADNIEDLPPNVVIRKWLPQQDILGHSKTVLFISHCGIFGTHEAKYHGVPVLGVPISVDQHRNAAILARKGYGRVLNWGDMTVESIVENINSLIKDGLYRDHLKAVSKALKDQKENPAERAVWWIEYTIRHSGAPHMKFAGKNLNSFQYHMVDVFSFLIAIMVLWISSCYLCIRRCKRKISRNKSKQE